MIPRPHTGYLCEDGVFCCLTQQPGRRRPFDKEDAVEAVYKPSLEEVRGLAAHGNLIAVHRELPADLETPVSVYLKLRARPNGPSFLLESVEKGEDRTSVV